MTTQAGDTVSYVYNFQDPMPDLPADQQAYAAISVQWPLFCSLA